MRIYLLNSYFLVGFPGHLSSLPQVFTDKVLEFGLKIEQ